MRLRLQWIAMLLSLSTTFLGIAPQSTLAALLNQKTSTQGTSTSIETGPYRKKNIERLMELTEKRDQHTKYFLNNDGSITAEASIQSRHYKHANGMWQDISNRLIPSKEAGFSLRNDANSFQTHFAANSQAQQLAKFKLDKDSFLAWGLENANNVTPTNTDEAVTYPDILSNTDLQYLPYSDFNASTFWMNSPKVNGEDFGKIRNFSKPKIRIPHSKPPSRMANIKRGV